MLLGHSLNIDHNLPLGDPLAESAQTGLGIKSLDKIRFSILEAGSGKLWAECHWGHIAIAMDRESQD